MPAHFTKSSNPATVHTTGGHHRHDTCTVFVARLPTSAKAALTTTTVTGEGYHTPAPRRRRTHASRHPPTHPTANGASPQPDDPRMCPLKVPQTDTHQGYYSSSASG